MRLHLELAGDVRQATVAAGRVAGTLDLSIGDEVVTCDVRDLGDGRLSLRLPDGSMHDVVVEIQPAGSRIVHVRGTRVPVGISTRQPRRGADGRAAAGPLRITAPMPGKVVRVPVQVGDAVEARQPVVVIEAMKMENALAAGRAGVVAEVLVQPGESVEAGRLLVVVE